VQQYGSGEPFNPVLEALEELCRRNPDVPALLRAVAPTWLLQLPWVSTAEEREALRNELVGATPERMLREMGEFLDRQTQTAPLLLITEDLHWADRPTLQLIDYVARRRSSAGVMWLSSFRLAEVVAGDHPLNALRHELRLHGLCEEIAPVTSASVLVLDGTYTLSASLLAFTNTQTTQVLEVTNASPRALTFTCAGHPEISQRCRHRGAPTTSAIPDNLLAIIEHYSSKLGTERRSLLAAAAVCGIEFRTDTVARVLERDAVRLRTNASALPRAALAGAPRAVTHSDVQEGAIRSAMLYSGRCSTIAWDRRTRRPPSQGGYRARTGACRSRTLSAAQLATHFTSAVRR
jgi:hypothetical protein